MSAGQQIKAGITQEELGERVGVSGQYIGKLERDEAKKPVKSHHQEDRRDAKCTLGGAFVRYGCERGGIRTRYPHGEGFSGHTAVVSTFAVTSEQP